MFVPIKSYSVIDEVSLQMKKLILDGSFQPGDLFPTEFDLAQQLNVSRTVIRESKKSLIGMGLLEVRGKRTYVCSEIYDAALGLLGYSVQMEKASLEELIETRIVIETETAALAAERASDEMIDRMNTLLAKQEEAMQAKDIVAFRENDLELHSVIADASGNRLLAKIISTIRNMSEVIVAATLELPQSDREAYRFHKKVIDAIISHDSTAARQAMRDHLMNIQVLVKKVVTEK